MAADKMRTDHLIFEKSGDTGRTEVWIVGTLQNEPHPDQRTLGAWS